MWLFGEVLTPTLVAGGAMTLGGIYWACRPRRRPFAGPSRLEKATGSSASRLKRLNPADARARPEQESGLAMSGRSGGSRTGGLAVYVTSHGFGHLNRTAAVLNRVPADVALTVKSNPNLFVHWRERLRRPAELQSFVSDVGAVNPPGDSSATDGPATVALAARVHAESLARLDDEVQRLAQQEHAAVLCDAPALPLLAARRAGIPGFLMTNFTWADIYAPYARAAGGEAMDFVRALRQVYRSATATFRTAPALAMSWLSPVFDVGMVVNQVKDRRVELRRFLGLKKSDRLVYLYVGRYGQSDLDWPRLAQQQARGVHFVTYPPLPAAGAVEPSRRSFRRVAWRRPDCLVRCGFCRRRAMARRAKRWPAARR